MDFNAENIVLAFILLSMMVFPVLLGYLRFQSKT